MYTASSLCPFSPYPPPLSNSIQSAFLDNLRLEFKLTLSMGVEFKVLFKYKLEFKLLFMSDVVLRLLLEFKLLFKKWLVC